MQGIKISSVFAAFGFFLSLISGLFSNTPFISVLLKALLFAVCFGILGFAINLVFQKFLTETGAAEYSADTSAVTGAASNPATGQVVDITIEDEELERSDSNNHFVVNENHQMLNDSDLAAAKSEPAEEAKPKGFVPLKNLETYKNMSGKEAVSPAAVEVKDDTSAAEEQNIDTLPDMNAFSFGDNNGSSSDIVDADSEFSSSGMNKHSDEPTEIKDAALMAKAISSILSDEED